MTPTVLPTPRVSRHGKTSPRRSSRPGQAAVSAVAGQGGHTLTEAPDGRPLVIQVGDQRHTFRADFTAGRDGNLAINDDFSSGHHARFQAVRGLWYVEDLGSTNGTYLQRAPHPSAPAGEETRQDQDRSHGYDGGFGISVVRWQGGSVCSRPARSPATRAISVSQGEPERSLISARLLRQRPA